MTKLTLRLDYARNKLKTAFLKNKNVSEKELTKCLERGEFVYKELEALYKLKKYRTLKRNYHY